MNEHRLQSPTARWTTQTITNRGDFVIGGSIDVLCRRFIITDADDYVLKHMESNPEQFPVELIEKWRHFKAKKTKEEEEEQ